MTQLPSQLSDLTNIPEDKEEEDYFDFFYDTPGTEPGTLTIEEDAIPSEIVLIDYSSTHASRKVNVSPQSCLSYINSDSVSWVDILGLGSANLLQEMGRNFDLHPLLLEDVVNVPQRPKVEDYNEHLLIIAQMVMLKPNNEGFFSEQVGFVLGKSYLLTFQEEPEHDCFEPVRDRIRSNRGRVRKAGVDYLAYALIDSIIDGFFPVLEEYGERIEALEDEVVLNPTRHTLERIYEVRRELLALRRAIWPQRAMINTLIRSSNEHISDDVQVYFRDCYDHVIQVLDIVETYRELASGLMDVYMSSVSNKMNEVMKLLTVISTIFIPLTFVVGVYGMNFEYMPELQTRWGYFACWGIMLIIATSLCIFFWRSGWFKNFYPIKED